VGFSFEKQKLFVSPRDKFSLNRPTNLNNLILRRLSILKIPINQIMNNCIIKQKKE